MENIKFDVITLIPTQPSFDAANAQTAFPRISERIKLICSEITGTAVRIIDYKTKCDNDDPNYPDFYHHTDLEVPNDKERAKIYQLFYGDGNPNAWEKTWKCWYELFSDEDKELVTGAKSYPHGHRSIMYMDSWLGRRRIPWQLLYQTTRLDRDEIEPLVIEEARWIQKFKEDHEAYLEEIRIAKDRVVIH